MLAAVLGRYPNAPVNNPASIRIAGPTSIRINPIIAALLFFAIFADGISGVLVFVLSMTSNPFI